MPEIRAIRIQPRAQAHSQSIVTTHAISTHLEVSRKYYILYTLKCPQCLHIVIAKINTDHIRIVYSQGRLAHQRLTPAQVGCIPKQVI